MNKHTGFEILELCEFGEAAIVPFLPFWTGGILMSTSPAPLLTDVIARKISAAHREDLAGTPGLAAGRYDPA